MPKKFEVENKILDKHILNTFLEAKESTIRGLDKKYVTDKVLQKLGIKYRKNQDKWQMKIYRRLKQERDSLIKRGILIEKKEEVIRHKDKAKMPKAKSNYILKMDMRARRAMYNIVGREELLKHQFIIDYVINNTTSIHTNVKLRVNSFKKYLREEINQGTELSEVLKRAEKKMQQTTPITPKESEKTVLPISIEDFKLYLSTSPTFFEYFFCYDGMAENLITWSEMYQESLNKSIEEFIKFCYFIDQVEMKYIKELNHNILGLLPENEPSC